MYEAVCILTSIQNIAASWALFILTKDAKLGTMCDDKMHTSPKERDRNLLRVAVVAAIWKYHRPQELNYSVGFFFILFKRARKQAKAWYKFLINGYNETSNVVHSHDASKEGEKGDTDIEYKHRSWRKLNTET